MFMMYSIYVAYILTCVCIIWIVFYCNNLHIHYIQYVMYMYMYMYSVTCMRLYINICLYTETEYIVMAYMLQYILKLNKLILFAILLLITL